MAPSALTLGLTPRGHLVLTQDDLAPRVDPSLADRLHRAFQRGQGHALLLLGADQAGTVMPPIHSYWSEFAARFVTALCLHGEGTARVDPPTALELESISFSVPPMNGAEYLTAAVLEDLWQQLDTAFHAELSESKLSAQEFLKSRNPAWNLVGRVHFNLAENRKDEDYPFAFLATYTTRLSAQAKAQHLLLGQALREYAGEANKDRLLSLLVPVQRASETCPWLKAMIEASEIFHPLRWSPKEALQVLRDVPQLEAAGVVVRMPAT